MIKFLKAYSFFLVCLFISYNTYSQSFSDLSNINFSELNGSQIDLLLRRASAQGYNEFDLLKMAQSQGLNQGDLEKLDKRFKSAKTVARVSENASTPLEETRLRKRWKEEMEEVGKLLESFGDKTPYTIIEEHKKIVSALNH